MAESTESWPDLSSELARKALETLDAAVFEYSQDRGQDHDEAQTAALRLVIDTITDVTQGLMPYEVTDLILKVRKGL